jgi:hypothetical protein
MDGQAVSFPGAVAYHRSGTGLSPRGPAEHHHNEDGMKRSILLLSVLSMLVGTAGVAQAAYYFDFEDNTENYGLLPGLESYMENIFGSEIAIDNANWWGESSWYDRTSYLCR